MADDAGEIRVSKNLLPEDEKVKEQEAGDSSAVCKTEETVSLSKKYSIKEFKLILSQNGGGGWGVQIFALFSSVLISHMKCD